MKTDKLRIISAVILFLAFFLSCTAQKSVWETEGWVDRDTYRVRGYSEAKPGVNSPVQAKGWAKDHAVADAQRRLEEKLKPPYDAGADDIVPPRAGDDVMAAIKAGKAIAVRYNEAYCCDVVYEVHAKGLWQTAVGQFSRHGDAGKE